MGRIRTLKPEFLSDEKIASLPDAARLLAVGLILLADDQGRGRAHPAFLAAQVWPYNGSRETLAKVSQSLDSLSAARFVILYGASGEHFYQIRHWTKHQKVDHPGKPRIPAPDCDDSREPRETLATTSETLAPDHGTMGPWDQDIQQRTKRPPRSRVVGDEHFNRFWSSYPRKVARTEAVKAWRAVDPGPDLVAVIVAAVDRQSRTRDWTKDNGQYIPHPATWLRQRRWEDEVVGDTGGSSTALAAPSTTPRPGLNAEVDRLRRLAAEIQAEDGGEGGAL